MSNLNLIDYILKSDGDNDNDTLDEMEDVLNDENNDFMRSDFFDSVLLLEESSDRIQEHKSDYINNMDISPSCSDTNSHFDEIQSNNSLSLDSDKWNETIKSPSVSISEENNFTFLEETFPIKSPERSHIINSPKKLIIDKSKGKKLYVTKINSNVKKNNYNNKQILRVKSLSGNGRSLLLPFPNVTTIKVLNASDLKADNTPDTKCYQQIKNPKFETYQISSPEYTEDEINTAEDRPGAPVILTAEEKRLLEKESIQLPAYHPLSKNNIRDLKRIRRKIRNKISAQDSRKRKKEYVDGLEERVKRGSEENKFLMKRVKQLQKQNSRLMAQMQKLQALLFNTTASKATPSTCLMIVLFSALLISLPNLRLSNDKELGDIQQIAARRALLFSQQATNEEDFNMEEFLLYNNKDDELENFIDDGADENETSTDNEKFDKMVVDVQNKYSNEDNSSETNAIENLFEFCNKYEGKIKDVFNKMKSFFISNELIEKDDYGGHVNKKGFIEPVIDEYIPDVGKKKEYESDIDNSPPSKKIKLNSPELNEKQQIGMTDFNENVLSATLNSAYKFSESKKQ